LKFFGRNDIETKEELNEIRQELARDILQGSSTVSLKNLFTIPYVRKGIFLGWMVIFSAAYSGIMALSYFSTSIIRSGGVSATNAQYATIGMTAPCCLGVLLGGLIMDRIGRRLIMLTANLILLILNIIFIIFDRMIEFTRLVGRLMRISA
jgi:MFS family permease